MSLLLAGCSGSGQGFSSASTTTNTLIGTWTRAEITGAGSTITCPNSLAENNVVIDSCVAGETIEFFAPTAPGSLPMYMITDPATKYGAVYTETGTYTYSGSTLTLTRNSTDIVAGVVTPGAVVTVSPALVIPNTIRFSGTNSFALQPLVPTSGSGYSEPETAEGATVTSTYTRN
jgi:hypothetical protein